MPNAREKRKAERAARFGAGQHPEPVAKLAEPPETMSRTEIVLTGQAMNARWPIPEERRIEIVLDLIATATTAEHDRDRVSAAKVLQSMDAMNMEQEKRDAVGFAESHQHEHHHTGAVATVDLTKLTDIQLEHYIASLTA